jgi:Family of unknown function (DUF5636)
MSYLTNSNPGDAEIKRELTSVFPAEFGDGKNADFLETCVRMAGFLATTASVEQQLKELEGRLNTATGLEFDKVLAHYRTRSAQPDDRKLEEQLRHLFSRELMALEIRLGFNTFQCVGGERVQTYVAFLNADSFRAQLKLGHHWKDPGVPGNHGEYTHRLQWYLLANALKDVVKEPVKQFMRIGGVIDPNKENAPSGLWDALFDRNDGEGSTKFKVQGNVTDCRSPESLTKFIVDNVNADKWPLVHWFIKSRMNKRQTKRLNEFTAAKAYVDRKIEKFRLNIPADGVVGTWRTFKGNTAPGILRPGAVKQRTPPQ